MDTKTMKPPPTNTHTIIQSFIAESEHHDTITHQCNVFSYPQTLTKVLNNTQAKEKRV